MSVAAIPLPHRIAAPRGLGLALASAAAFGSSGTFAKTLTQAGWTPGGAVLARVTLASLLLLVPGVLAMRGQWGELLGSPARIRAIVMFGLVSVAGCQLSFYLAIQHVSVGVAMLLEYLGPIMLMGWAWVATRTRPSTTTLAGAAVAIVGLVVVLDVVRGTQVNLAGVGWGLASAACVATYFHISAHGAQDVPPLALTWLGLSVGAIGLAIAGAFGLVPMAFDTRSVILAGTSLPFWVSVLGVALVSTVLAYATGVMGTRHLGATVASFVGLAEVVFTMLIAWVVLGQALGVTQALGAAVMLAGVIMVQNGSGEESAPVPD